MSTNVVEDKDIPQQVTSKLMPIEHQVGSNVAAALQDPETVGVLTTVVMGHDGSQYIVSIGLGPDLLWQVQYLLKQAKEERAQGVPCVGFHCSFKGGDEDQGS